VARYSRNILNAQCSAQGHAGLSSLVQESLGRDPFAGDGGRSGSLIKALWHEGIGLSLYAKRLDHGRFVCPVTVGGVVGLTAAQAEMSYLLEAIDWRNPQHTGGHRARDNVKKCLEVRKKRRFKSPVL
jgi:transposase